MENQNHAQGDAISQLLVSTEVLHALMREIIHDPSLSEDVLRRARTAVGRICDHFAQQPDKASDAAQLQRLYVAEIDAAITHRP